MKLTVFEYEQAFLTVISKKDLKPWSSRGAKETKSMGANSAHPIQRVTVTPIRSTLQTARSGGTVSLKERTRGDDCLQNLVTGKKTSHGMKSRSSSNSMIRCRIRKGKVEVTAWDQGASLTRSRGTVARSRSSRTSPRWSMRTTATSRSRPRSHPRSTTKSWTIAIGILSEA